MWPAARSPRFRHGISQKFLQGPPPPETRTVGPTRSSGGPPCRPLRPFPSDPFESLSILIHEEKKRTPAHPGVLLDDSWLAQTPGAGASQSFETTPSAHLIHITPTLSTATHTCCERCQTSARFAAPPTPTDRCRSVPGAGSGSTATRPASGPRGKPATGKSAGGSGRGPPPRPRPLRRLPRQRLLRQVPAGRGVAEEVVHPRPQPRLQPRLALPRRRPPARIPVPPTHHRGTPKRRQRRTRAKPNPTLQTDPRPATNRTPPTLPYLIVTPRRRRRRRRA